MPRFAFLKSEVNGGRQPLHYFALFFAKLAPALQTACAATRACGIRIHHRRLVNHNPSIRDLKFPSIEKAGGRTQEPPPAVNGPNNCALNIIVQRELVRMRPQANRVNFAFAFVIDPRLEHVGRKHVSL